MVEKGKKSGVGGIALAKKRASRSNQVPEDYLSVDDWAKRAGITKGALSNAIGRGMIPDKYFLSVPHQTGTRRLVINWDNCAYQFFANRMPKDRPDDWFENPEKLFKPILQKQPERPVEPVRTVAKLGADGDDPEQVEIDFGNLLDGKMPASQVLDYPAAKFRREQLKILQDQIAVKVATNALVKTEDVGSMLRSLAAEVSGELVKMETHLAPVLAACSDPREVRRLLRDGIEAALRPLSGSDGTP